MKTLFFSSLLATGVLALSQAVAQSPKPTSPNPMSPKPIAIELNTSETAGSACRLTFVIHNRLADPISKLGLDLVMFDRSEGVSGFAAVDFGKVSAGKTVVRQYDVGKGACSTLSRVLLNEVRACEIGGAKDSDCLSKLDLSSRSDIAFAP